MSGGVDSSVAAAILLQLGHEVVGCFMRLGSAGDTFDELLPAESCAAAPSRPRGCCSVSDAADARSVAARLGIPFYVCNFRKDFDRVIDYFVDEYNAGRTPNPCVRCNDWLKFGKLHDYAERLDARYVATGHYARIAGDPPRLLQGVDRDKDQSYVLFGTPRERLRRMLLPIGGHRKPQVRQMARDLGLPVAEKPDSQEICFVPDGDYAGLLGRRAPGSLRPGTIVDRSGAVLGEHDGHQHFTIGQRRGLGLALGHPIYVVDKDAETNRVTVGDRRDLLSSGCRAARANWLADSPSRQWIACTARIRSNGEPVAARLRLLEPEGIEVVFDEPQCAVAPGQAVVCYLDDAVLCGGWIDERLPAQLAHKPCTI